MFGTDVEIEKSFRTTRAWGNIGKYARGGYNRSSSQRYAASPGEGAELSANIKKEGGVIGNFRIDVSYFLFLKAGKKTNVLPLPWRKEWNEVAGWSIGRGSHDPVGVNDDFRVAMKNGVKKERRSRAAFY